MSIGWKVKHHSCVIKIKGASNMRYPGLLQTYKQYLPINKNTPMITLHEGNTPLIRADRLSEFLNLNIYLR